MPRQTHRRELISDATIQVLAQHGMHGLTHRAVDAEAEIPVGTTSRYFRTRATLLIAAAEAVRDQHRVRRSLSLLGQVSHARASVSPIRYLD